MRGHVRRVVSAVMMAALVMTAMLLIPDFAGGHGVPQPECDFITGGGWVVTDGGAKGTYGAHGGCKHGGFWGHVNYVDHNTSPGFHVRSTEITGYLSPTGLSSAPERDICAIGVVVKPGATTFTEGETVRLRARMIDDSEPGGLDDWGIRVKDADGNEYHLSTRELGPPGPTGGGGNNQLHKPNNSTTAPDPLPSEAAMCPDPATTGGILAEP